MAKENNQEQIEYYLQLPYTIETELVTDDGDPYYVARYKELKGCLADGETVEEAVSILKEIQKEWISMSLETNLPIPLPETRT